MRGKVLSEAVCSDLNLPLKQCIDIKFRLGGNAGHVRCNLNPMLGYALEEGCSNRNSV